MRRNLGSQSEEQLRRGPCVWRPKHAAAAMTKIDLLRTLAIRTSLRSKVMRSHRCDCVLKQFRKDGTDSQNSSDPQVDSIREILWFSDSNTKEDNNNQNNNNVNQVLRDLLLSSSSSNSRCVVSELILPLYWLTKNSPLLRVQILSLLSENLDHRAMNSSLPNLIAQGAVTFANSVCDCVCSMSSSNSSFVLLSDEEGDLLDDFVNQVCLLIDNQESSQDGAVEYSGSGGENLITKRAKDRSRHDDDGKEQEGQIDQDVALFARGDVVFESISKKDSKNRNGVLESAFSSLYDTLASACGSIDLSF
jgi:hypothetical protein